MRSKTPNIDLGVTESDLSAFNFILKQYLKNNLYTCQPVIVEKVHDGKVDVKPLLIDTTITGEEIKITDDDIIYNVPFMKFKGKNFNLTLKANKDDKGLLIACMRDISKYKQTHKEAVVGSKRCYNASDGFFLPFDFEDEDGSSISFQNGDTGLTITEDTVTINCTTANINATTINLGGEGGQPVARVGDRVNSDGEIVSGSSKVKAV